MNNEGLSMGSPIDSGRHIYTNWEPILNYRGAHHPGRDAFKLTPVPVQYTPDMCPQTIDILNRTVYFGTSINRPQEDLQHLIQTLKKVAGQV